jgi:hypothetical protein
VSPGSGRSRRRTWLTIGAIIAALICFGPTVASWFSPSRTTPDKGPATVALPSFRPPVPASAVPSPSFSAPVATVTGGPTSFDLSAGTAVRFTDKDGTWVVALLGVEWFDECEDVLGDTVPAVVFDIRYEVIDGAVSVIPMNDFAFILVDGTRLGVGPVSACAKHPLDYAILSKPEVERGQIAIELPSGTHGVHGKVTYTQLGPPTASWTIPAREG